jgi:hypothetical protein
MMSRLSLRLEKTMDKVFEIYINPTVERLWQAGRGQPTSISRF